MYVVPLSIHYKDREYTDGVDITPQEIYDGLATEIPKTSLPSGERIIEIFDRIKADGYEKVLAVTISSGLSGTNNFITVLSQQYEGLETFVLDTKNIAIASGFSAIQAAIYLEEGMDWETLKETVQKDIPKSKVFFCVKTLEYLQKGGRIGLVASILGNALNLKPIISCNEDGIYDTVAKVRGREQSIKKTIDMAVQFAQKGLKYNVALCHGDAEQEALAIRDHLKALLPHSKIFLDGQISPALGVHTGPGLIGIAVQLV